jgi:alcohol dehydrogenase
VNDGADVAAREEMMLGAFHAGTAFGTAGTAAAHAIQYPVGAATHTPHGIGVALLMPYVMEFNKPVCVGEFAEIARALGVGGQEDDEAALADRAIDTVAEMFQSVGIPPTLADLGISHAKQRWIAEQAFTAARLVKNNPRPLDVDGLERIVHAALVGDRLGLREAQQPLGVHKSK